MSISLVVALPLNAESVEVEWGRQFGTTGEDVLWGISVDSSGAYAAGYTVGTLPGQTSAGGKDAFVRKYDTTGTEMWTRQFGTTGTDWAYDISVDSSGVYVAGYTGGTFPSQTSEGYDDVFVRKYNAAGTEVWTRQFGTAGVDWAYGISVDSSGVYVTGVTGGTFLGQTSAGGYDSFVRKYDTTGTEVWTRQFGTAGDDYAYGISVDSSGVYVSGNTDGTFPGQTSFGMRDVFVRKYNTAGTEMWTRQFGTASFDTDSWISVDSSGVYVAGATMGTFPGQTSAGGMDAFVRKYDTAGTEMWTRQFGSTTTDAAFGISVDSSGVYITGQTYGTLPGQTSAGGYDTFVCKYDDMGTEMWTRQFGTAGSDYGRGISFDSSGVYVAGKTDGTFPGETNEGGLDAFLAKLIFPRIDVAPGSIEFGDVAEGSSTTAIVTISNLGNADLTVTAITLTTDDYFSITSAPTTPVDISAGVTVDVEITFAPSTTGIFTDALQITSNDPDHALVEVSLSGTGVTGELPPGDQINNILTVFDTSVEDETLIGDGQGNSANGRLGALRNMLEAAGDLIEEGSIDEACEQLEAAYRRTDGIQRPPDFVSGTATEELGNLILALIDTLESS